MTAPRASFLRHALFNGNGVAKRLIVALVLFSSVITAAITAIELYAEYRRDLGEIDRSMTFIGQSYLPSLTDSVWVADHEQVQAQIDGLRRLPDIEYLGITAEGQTRWSSGQVASKRRVTTEIPLLRQHRGETLQIGTLQVVASVDRVLERLWSHLLTVLVSNGIKTLLVAGFMLLVFQYLVTRHLMRLADFLRRVDPTQPRGEQLQLERAATGRWRPDVLDSLTATVNGLSRSLSQASVELGQSEQRLRALTRATSTFIYEIGRDGRVLFANRTYDKAVPLDQVEGAVLVDCFPPALRAPIEQALTRAFADARPQRFEYTMPYPNGQERTFLAAVMPFWRDGEVGSVSMTAMDISQQKLAERAVRKLNDTLEERVRTRTAELRQAVERAESASRAKSEFLSGMSHELRTPLNAILGFAQIIEMSNPSPKQLQWAGEIRRAGDHLLLMIEDLLDLARIEAGKLAMTIEALDLESVITEAAAIIQPLVAGRGLRLQQLCHDVNGRVLADKLRLRQVLVNLLSNAVKYNRQDGEITVRCERRGDRVRLSVTDTGMGIAPEQLAKLFQPFERLGAEHGSVEGTGIGLALSRQLAEAMGATLGADTTVGVGSVFWLDLQLAGQEDEVPARALEATPPTDWMGDLAGEVLYVEDKASNTALVSTFLAPYTQLRLRSASTGREGVALARDRRPDLVLLDIHLPDIDGYAVLRELRADARLRGVPIVALSADAMTHDIERGLAAGFDRYLSKPIDLNRLLTTLSEFLRKPAA